MPDIGDEKIASGPAGKLIGKIKQAAGGLVGNEDLEREGRLQESQVDATAEAEAREERAEQVKAEADLEAERREKEIERERLQAERAAESREQAIEREKREKEARLETEKRQEEARAEAARREKEALVERERDVAVQERTAAALQAGEMRAAAVEAERRAQQLDGGNA